MKKLLFLALAALTMFSTSCDDEGPLGPTTTVNLNLKATFDGDPLVMLQRYQYPDGKEITWQNFNFFISEVALLEAEGGDVAELVDVDFADFSDNDTAPLAEQPATFTALNVPAGSYKGVRLSIGVPADLNNAAADQFGAGHPLKQNFASHFWSDWGSFIFMVSEGIYDLDGNGVLDGSDVGFGHHPGTDAVLEKVTLLHPIVLEEGKPFDLNVLVDVLKLYVKDGAELDLSLPENKDTQQAADLPLMNYFMDNFQTALSIE